MSPPNVRAVVALLHSTEDGLVAIATERPNAKSGRFRFVGLRPEGVYTLRITARGRVPWRKEGLQIGRRTFDVGEVLLEQGAVISGTIAPTSRGMLVVAVGQTNQFSWEARVDDQTGRFAFDGVPPGRYELRILGGLGRFIWPLCPEGVLAPAEAAEVADFVRRLQEALNRHDYASVLAMYAPAFVPPYMTRTEMERQYARLTERASRLHTEEVTDQAGRWAFELLASQRHGSGYLAYVKLGRHAATDVTPPPLDIWTLTRVNGALTIAACSPRVVSQYPTFVVAPQLSGIELSVGNEKDIGLVDLEDLLRRAEQ